MIKLPKHIHVIGICGVATSALAIAFQNAGVKVTGSDKGFYPPVSTELEKHKISFYAGWHPEKMIENGVPDLVVITTASGTQNILQEIPNPRFLTKELDKIKHLSHKLSRAVKGSKNRLKARLKLSKQHAKVKNQRTNFVQQLSTQMVKNHDIFCIESLDISKLLQTSPRGLSRSISDAGWRSFLHCLKYKAQQSGKHIIEAGKYFPSSQICSSCNNSQKMPLEQRVYKCLGCGLEIGRDYNSAIVLKAAGMSVLKLVELPY